MINLNKHVIASIACKNDTELNYDPSSRKFSKEI
jgi:hypothetical protein